MGLVLTAWLAVANPGADVDAATELFRAGQYRQALALLDAALADSKLPDNERTRALEHQAFCLFALELYPQARDTWRALRRLAPTHSIDPNKVSPEFVSFFRRAEEGPLVGAVAVEQPAPAVEVVGCAPFLCALPFGTGQFVNDQPIKGSLFLAIEALSLATNLGLYWAQSPTEPPSDRYTLAQHAALGTFALAAVIGILDAYLVR